MAERIFIMEKEKEPSFSQQLKSIKEHLGNSDLLINNGLANLDTIRLQIMQQQQTIEQYRVAIYNLELRSSLVIKILEEKGILAREEFEKRWPLYLKNDIGIISSDGKMEGTLKITMYGDKGE